MDDLCVSCNNPIRAADKEFAENQEQHPGILGVIHQSCYDKEVEKYPQTPWEDPISGEVDYEEMAEDLGFDAEYEDWEEEGL